jgi:hypothetical protein
MENTRKVGLNSRKQAFGGGTVHPSGVDTAPPKREIKGNRLKERINHFGFELESVEALVPVCKQWGAATDVKKRPPNREAESRVWDPDGNPIDLSQHGWPH